MGVGTRVGSKEGGSLQGRRWEKRGYRAGSRIPWWLEQRK